MADIPVSEFLKKKREELFRSNTERQELLCSLQRELTEKKKYKKAIIKQLEIEQSDFSPRSLNKESTREVRKTESDISKLIIEIDNLEEILNKEYQELEEYDKMISQTLSMEEACYSFEKKAFENHLKQNSPENFKLKILSTQEQERTRIARDLHDSPVQLLTALIHKLEYCQMLMESDTEKTRQELINSTDLLKKSIREMRQIIYDLRPMVLDDFGLEISLERELNTLKEIYGVNTKLDVQCDLSQFDNVVSSTIFRIVQEACSNAVKHAEPKNITVSFLDKDDHIEFHIKDDGIGFDTSNHIIRTEKEWYGFGMNTMKERIFLLSGQLFVRSRVGEGTDLRITIPKNQDKEGVTENGY